MEPLLKGLNQQAAAETVEAYIQFAKPFSGTGLQSHQFLRGLLGFLAQYHPEMVEQIKKLSAPGRIIRV